MLRHVWLIAFAGILLHLAGCAKPGPDLVKCEAIEQEASAASTMVNQAAPGFALVDQADKPVSLAQLRGDWVVLYLYPKADMPPCECDATDYTRCLLGLGRLTDAKFFAVTDLSPMNLRAFLAVYKVQMNLLSDRQHTAMTAYKAWSPQSEDESGPPLRTTVIVDPQGVIRYHWPHVEWAGHADRVARKLAELKAGEGSMGRPLTTRPAP